MWARDEVVEKFRLGGADVGQHIVSSNIDALVFTGGIETAQKIVKNAGIKPVLLEASGNDAAIVCADADLEQAVRGITFGTFLHGGQVCIRIKRVYIEEKIADTFIAQLVEHARALRLGQEIMPLIRDAARRDVHRKVSTAIEQGAQLLLGGEMPDGPGFFYPPTILLLNEDSLEVSQTETFGPVCCIHPVKDLAEAVSRANDTRYGLGASVWTQNEEKAQEISLQLEAGTVWVNDSNIPLVAGEYFQGWKDTSIASTQDRLSLFQKKKVVIHHKAHQCRDWWY